MSTLTAGRLTNEERDGRFSRATIWTICLALAGFFVWASMTTVHEVISGEGLLVPEGRVMRVEHLDGGRVTELLVRDGDRVTRDEPLLRLARDDFEAERRATAARIKRLDAEIARHKALAELDLSPDGGPTLTPEGTDPGLRREIAFRKAQIAAVDAQRGIAAAKLAALASQEETFAAELKILRARADRFGRARSGIFTVRETDDLDREILGLERSLGQIGGEAGIVAAEIARHDATERELVASYRREATLRLEERRESRVAAAETLSRIDDRLERTAILSPRTGTISLLSVRGAGEIVEPGEVVAEIVPSGARLMAEIEVSADRIAGIRVGQTANVKVLTYDFTRFGEADATVERISASSYRDDAGRSVYRMNLALDESSFARDLAPGMTVMAELRSGDRTILEFLLRPTRILADRSFVEP